MMGRPPRGHPPKPPRVTLPRARDHRDILKRRSIELIRKIEDKDKHAIFLEPVEADQVPGYADVITRPMDLSTIRKSVTMGVYRTPAELRADIDLIWANCIKFNADGSIYYREAVRLRALAGKYFEEFLRNLARDGLPYGPRRAGPAHSRAAQQLGASLAASSAQLKAAAAASLQTPTQRLRNIARARRKALLEAAPQSKPTPVERAAADAAARLLPASEKTQIYNGPYQRLRRFPNVPAATAFPFVRGTPLQQRLEPFPPAWNALWRWRHPSPRQSNLISQERDYEMHIARRYQNYVDQAAPTARRLLATILDPLIVEEHDGKLATKDATPANDRADLFGVVVERGICKGVDNHGELHNALNHEARPSRATAPAPSPRKRPRHGAILDSSSPNYAPLSRAQLKVMLEPTYNNLFDALKQKSRTFEPPSPDAVQELRNALKAYNLDDTFLAGILNSSNISKQFGNPPASKEANTTGSPSITQTCSETLLKSRKATDETPAIMDVDAGSIPNDKTGILQRKSYIDGIANSLPDDPADNLYEMEVSSPAKLSSDKPSVFTGDDDIGVGDSEMESGISESEGESDGGSEIESESNDGEEISDSDSDRSVSSLCQKDAELDELLRNNHATLLNVLRLRALKEVATGIARKDLQAEEEKYAAVLREGVALASSKLPPNLLIPREQATEVALEAAKQTLGRKRKRQEMEEVKNIEVEKTRLAEQEKTALKSKRTLPVTTGNANAPVHKPTSNESAQPKQSVDMGKLSDGNEKNHTNDVVRKSIDSNAQSVLNPSNAEYANGCTAPNSVTANPQVQSGPMAGQTPVKKGTATGKLSNGLLKPNGLNVDRDGATVELNGIATGLNEGREISDSNICVPIGGAMAAEASKPNITSPTMPKPRSSTPKGVAEILKGKEGTVTNGAPAN